MLEIMNTVEQWIENGERIALATVTQTWGSAPRKVGAKMAVTDSLLMTGSVSGGCVETAVVEEAVESLKSGKPRLLHFGVSDDMAWEVGLTCGGKISVFVEPLDLTWWQHLTASIGDNQRRSTITALSGDLTGQKLLVDQPGQVIHTVGAAIAQHQADFLAALQQSRQSRQTRVNEVDILIDIDQPRPHLIIIGGVHVAMPLQQFAQILGFRVSVIDPRQVFATPERFPEAETILHSYPDKALLQLGLDTNTYVAVLTHDPKIDDPALITALPSSAAYIGVLSSKRTHEARLQRLRKAGVNEADFDRIHTPIGIDIGADTPEEIALSIMSEIIAVRNKDRS
jgi:xanthine dehydrogenase accessory factor